VCVCVHVRMWLDLSVSMHMLLTYRRDKIRDVHFVSNAEFATFDWARQVHVLHQITDVVGLFVRSRAKHDQPTQLASSYLLVYM
jgi:hypothetical protein